MRLKNWAICVLLGGVTLLSACARLEKYLMPQKSQEFKDQQQADEVAADMRRLIAEDIVSARILVNAYPYEGLFVMPAKELAQLKNILSRMEAIPPARGEPVVVYVSYPAVDTLVLVDKNGGTYDFPVMMNQWMKKSDAVLLPITRPHRSDEARWSLPDEDYAALAALPTVRQARAWAKLHSRGTALIIPNKRTTPVQSPAAAPATPAAPALAASAVPAAPATPAAPAPAATAVPAAPATPAAPAPATTAVPAAPAAPAAPAPATTAVPAASAAPAAPAPTASAAPAAPEAPAPAASAGPSAYTAQQQPFFAPSTAVPPAAPAEPAAASAAVAKPAAKPVVPAAAKPAAAKPVPKPAAPSAIDALIAPAVPQSEVKPIMPKGLQMPSSSLPM